MKPMKEEHLAILRRHMVEVIAIKAELMSDELGKTLLNQRVLTVMGRVPRHLFVPAPLAPHAYRDSPLPIGFDKTISQPFIVALMTDLLDPQEHESVLEIGTGLGYQTAVLAELAGRVWSVRRRSFYGRQVSLPPDHARPRRASGRSIVPPPGRKADK
jgi:protein-L-isoaspartate(D-aspartate) O-methyltransferase